MGVCYEGSDLMVILLSSHRRYLMVNRKCYDVMIGYKVYKRKGFQGDFRSYESKDVVRS